ncbi:MAG: transcription antitermination protein NusB [Patescibacteria group bacterium]
MKTKEDPRHQHRVALFQLLYSQQFSKQSAEEHSPDITKTLRKIVKNKAEILSRIDGYAQKFSSNRMSKLDLTILILAVYELYFEKKEPYKVIADEAIEIAKEFGSTNSPQFISGIIGKLISDQSHEQSPTT